MDPVAMFKHLDSRLDKIETYAAETRAGIGVVAVDIAEIKGTLKGQALVLEEHIARTRLLETAVLPLQAHVASWSGAFKVLVVLGALVGLAAGVWGLISG